MTREEAIDILDDNFTAIDTHGHYTDEEVEQARQMAIKALEQEPCEDTISRQAAIDAMVKIEQDDIEQYGCAIPEGFDSSPAIEALEGLQPITPQPETGHWIPVSERFPEEGEDVLACFYTGEGNYKIMVSHRSDYNYWSGVGRTADMVAWMPLPEPYKAESEGKE